MSAGERMSANHDCGGEAAAYVLGALEPEEAEAFRRHLEQCAVCREEVEALEGVVQALPMAAPQQPVPRALRRRVLRAVRAEPRPRPKRSRWTLLRSSPWGRVAAGALACALAAGAIIAGLTLSSPAGSSRVIQARVSGVSGSAELRLSDGHGELIVHHLSPPPPGEIYEVWLKAPHQAPTPASVLFTVGAGGGADVGLPDRLRGINEVMVTAEPQGGTLFPTHPAVIVAEFS